jgi:hypothetical protein
LSKSLEPINLKNRTNLCENEVHVDPGGDENQRGEHPEGEGVGILPPKDQETEEEEQDGGNSPSKGGGNKPGQHNGDDSLVGGESGTRGVFLGPDNGVTAPPHESKPDDTSNCEEEETCVRNNPAYGKQLKESKR